MFDKRAGVFHWGIKPRAEADKTRPASLLNGFKNILQRACLLGVRTKVQIVKGRYKHKRKTSYGLSVFLI